MLKETTSPEKMKEKEDSDKEEDFEDDKVE